MPANQRDQLLWNAGGKRNLLRTATFNVNGLAGDNTTSLETLLSHASSPQQRVDLLESTGNLPNAKSAMDIVRRKADPIDREYMENILYQAKQQIKNPNQAPSFRQPQFTPEDINTITTQFPGRSAWSYFTRAAVNYNPAKFQNTLSGMTPEQIMTASSKAGAGPGSVPESILSYGTTQNLSTLLKSVTPADRNILLQSDASDNGLNLLQKSITHNQPQTFYILLSSIDNVEQAKKLLNYRPNVQDLRTGQNVGRNVFEMLNDMGNTPQATTYKQILSKYEKPRSTGSATGVDWGDIVHWTLNGIGAALS